MPVCDAHQCVLTFSVFYNFILSLYCLLSEKMYFSD